MSRRRGLGSGLDALLSSGAVNEPIVREVAVGAIRQNRSQPRSQFDEQALAELAASISEHGVLQPLVVAADPEGGYELIAGERRWRAAKRAGLERVPVIIKEATPQQLLELAIVENVQRADLNPLEEGRAYQTLKDEFGLTDEAIAQRVGKSRVAVVNTRRLLRLVPEAGQALLDGAISAGHGRALLRVENESAQMALLQIVQGRDLSVRETERLAEVVQSPAVSEPIRRALLHGQISLSQAQALVRLEEAEQQSAVLDLVLTEGLSVRDTEQLVELVVDGLTPAQARERLRGAIGRTVSVSPPAPAEPERLPREREEVSLSAEDSEAQQMFATVLGTPVQLHRSAKSVRLTITFYNDEQLQALYDRLADESH